ncbi:RNA-binding domain-containing protein [Pleurotus pulmonarius]
MAASPTLAIRAPGSPPSVKQEPLAVDTTPNFKISADSALNGSNADARAADNERPPTTASPSPTVQEPESKEPNTRGGSVADSNGAGKGDSFRDRQAKPNKVYIGGLPTNTRIEDLRSCFGKIGTIVQIELKIGYGFVEFDSTEAAEESVAKYNEGYFMGNKIRVEISHGGRATRTTAEAGTCFRCGDNGHWARECPNAPPPDPRDSHSRRSEPPLIDRIQRDYPPPRDHPSYRDDYGPSGRLPPPPRDSRYYDYPPSTRDYPAVGTTMTIDVLLLRYPPPTDSYRGYAAPPASYPYDRYERRSMDRYAGPPAPPLTPVGRPRTPPRHARDDYDRPPPPRDYPEYRGRPITPPPPRYPPDYARTGSVEVSTRYRRRSESPPSRGAYEPPYPSGPPRDPYAAGYGAPPRTGSRDYPPSRGREVDYRRP